MRSLLWSILLITLITVLACSPKAEQDKKKNRISGVELDTIVMTDTVYLRDTVYLPNKGMWQQFFAITNQPNTDSIWGQPVSYYISDPDCHPLAFDFYYGTFRPGDNASTAYLLSLVTTENDKLRPYYRWCLEKTIQIADGALGEYPGEPALDYAERYPAEFMEYVQYHQDTGVYWDWVGIISYSGLHKYKYDDELALIGIVEEMKENCQACPDSLDMRFEQFAKDVVKATE